MKDNKLKKWEMALALSVCITLCQGITVNWWSVIFPGLAPAAEPALVETAKIDGPTVGGVQLRFQILEWLDARFFN